MLYNIYRQTSKIFSQKFPRKVARIKYKFYLCSAFDKNTGLWCNGNITDSGPVVPGSNPGSPTKQTALCAVCFFILKTKESAQRLKNASAAHSNNKLSFKQYIKQCGFIFS